ncbi:hypothetical protein [Streptomyces sp. YIM B13518]|uniref:hypothetical protein n=1 Tax=Streptomyces sp. YIM B13518 TaxID=3366316 RepID=UPI0036976FCA
MHSGCLPDALGPGCPDRSGDRTGPQPASAAFALCEVRLLDGPLLAGVRRT